MRLLFVSHTFPLAHAPMKNIGGMQRVATELHDALQARDDLVLHSIVLRSSWKWIHVNVLRFLGSLAIRLERDRWSLLVDRYVARDSPGSSQT